MVALIIANCRRLSRFLPLLSFSTMVLMAGATDCPVRLLNIESRSTAATGTVSSTENDTPEEGLQLVEDGLQYLSQQQSPLYMVPTLGVYRSGKSLLLNRLMGLRTPYAGGFGVGHDQQTFTRGIDICAEEIPDLGTIIWMDTEGLFSSEAARSVYGPKLFSLALLLASSVVLNSVKVFNDQFFVFFGEQQQLARLLRQGLVTEELPSTALLPTNLSVFWVLQQPIHFDGKGVTSQAQLEAFLSLPGDELRACVQRDFHHRAHEVPMAAHDIRLWQRLNELEDDELVPEYVAATSQLRKTVLESLQNARPMHATSTTTLLKMYVELVQKERFSKGLVKNAFEEMEIGNLCNHYGHTIITLAGELPSPTLQVAFNTAHKDIEVQRASVMEEFHFGSEWSERLEYCFHGREEELKRRNSDLVLAEWRAAASVVAEEDECFFLGRLVKLLREYAETYGNAFGPQIQASAVDYASSLQRARLVECVRLRNFLLPSAPWVIGPICVLYLQGGVIRGFLSMVLHIVVLAGVYMLLQLFHQVPMYLDLDYPILRLHPMLLDLVMRAPPLMPWATMGHALSTLGMAWSTWRVVRSILHLGRPAGHGHMVNQMVGLELKLNTLLVRSEAVLKQQLVKIALNISKQLEKGNTLSAIESLFEGLCFVRELAQENQILGGIFADARTQRQIRKLLQSFSGAGRQSGLQTGGPSCRPDHDLVGLVAQSDWEQLLKEMMALFEKLLKMQGVSSVGQRATMPDLEKFRSRMQRSPSPLRCRNIALEQSLQTSQSPAPATVSSTEAQSCEKDVELELQQEVVAECSNLFDDENDGEEGGLLQSPAPPTESCLEEHSCERDVELELQQKMVVESTFSEEQDDDDGEGTDKGFDSPEEDGDEESSDEKKLEDDAELVWDDNEDVRHKTHCSYLLQALVVLMVGTVACTTISVAGACWLPNRGLYRQAELIWGGQPVQ